MDQDIDTRGRLAILQDLLDEAIRYWADRDLGGMNLRLNDMYRQLDLMIFPRSNAKK